ncbi:MAG: InlB B-repeat-containing protein [Clostridiales bacterium]|nr:InlB B-repeat-containing protein [Clostridiales bacterium]
MKFRKAIIFLLCAVMSLSMLACGSIDMPDGGVDNPNGVVTSGKTYTITFDVNASDVAGITPIQVGSGKTMGSQLKTPSRSGYAFVGWFDASGKQYTSETVITGNVVLTARWQSSAEVAEAAKAYENNISTWAKPGHLYIHYKRAAHITAEQVTPPAGGIGANAPLYSKESTSETYKDWALWCWPKGGDGRTFNLAWIDESGAVYDVDLSQQYSDAGWDGSVVPGVPLNSQMNYKDVDEIGTQLFKVSSRKKQGYWQNDGGNVYVKLEEAKREGGDYHWFVSESKVTQGTPQYTAEEIEDVYGKIPAGSAITATAGPGIINSNSTSTYEQWTGGVQNFTSNTGYQIFIASFCDSDGDGIGDIKGIISKLDYLERLNVDMLWLTPFQSSTNYHGYDINDYFSIDSRWGSANDYRNLVDQAHAKGMKVVMDFVLNHTSEANEWFIKSKNLVTEQNVTLGGVTHDSVNYRNFYSWINQAQYDKLSEDAKKQWYGDEHDYYFYSSFGSSMPELNYDYQPVRDAILDVCYKWMEYGLDGFRLDAVKHIYMKNEVEGKGGTCSVGTPPNGGVVVDGLYSHDQTRNYHFYREFNYRLKSNYPNAFVVGENLDGWNQRTKNYYQGIDSQFDFNTYYASRGFATIRGIPHTNGSTNLNESSMGAAYTTYQEGYNMFKQVNPNFISGQFTSNHDLPRARNRMALKRTNGVDVDEYAKIEGNLINDSYYALFLYYGMIFTVPGVTWLYYGDEIGMEGIMDYTLTSQSTDSLQSSPHEDRTYRQPMKWTADTNTSFNIGYSTLKCELTGLNATTSVKSVAEQEADNTSLLSWVKELTKIRKDYKLGQATAISGSGSGSRIEYTVTGGNGQRIKVTIVANGSAGTGNLASKTVTIGGKTCSVAINRA